MKKQLLVLFCLLSILILPYFVFAENPAVLENLENVGEGGGYAKAERTSVAAIAGTAINTALSLLGIAFIIFIIYGGFLWLTASGSE